jgi:hypothetical protein
MGIRQELCEHYGDDMLFADGYDDAIIGVCTGHDSGRVAYDIHKMVSVCINDMGITESEAWEWLEFNTFCAYVGKNTPLYIYVKGEE